MSELESFKSWLRRRDLRDKTLQAYQAKVDQFSEYCSTHQLDISEVTAQQIDYYLQYLLIRKRHKPNSRLLAYTAISQFYEFLISQGIISVNPVREANAPKKEKHRGGSLTNDEVTLLIHAPGLKTEIGMRDTAIIAILAAVGARASAICGLRVNDIRAEEVMVPPRCLHCGQIDYSGRSRMKPKKKTMAIVILREKGGKEWDIPLHNTAAFYLNQYLIHRKKAVDSSIVFPCYSRQIVQPLTRHGLLALVRKYGERVGIKGNVSPHRFRHAAITWLLDCGVPLATVKDFFGHSDIATTERYRNLSHRSFMFSGIASERSLLEAIETPMDAIIQG